MSRASLLTLCVICLLSIGCGDSRIARIENESLSVAIALKGAELQSIRGKRTDTEYLWQGDPEYWARRAIVMFPANVAFREWKFSHRGSDYEMPFLGLVESGEFEVRESASDSVLLEFESTSDAQERYPFPFRFEVRYAVEGSALVQEHIIHNLGTETMYFATGGHPGFRAPLDEGSERGDYEIVFAEKLNVDRMVVAENLHQNRYEPYLKGDDRLALDDPRVPSSGMFLKGVPVRQIGVALKGEAPYMTVDLGDFPNVNLWTPPGMPFVCIEPMVGHHDRIDAPFEISEKDCVVSLEAGKTASYRFSMTVDESAPGP